MPETKIWDHFSIQIYPLLVGNMASETTFGHWKVVFSWGKGRKMTFSQNPLSSRFWASGFWMSILSSANFKKDPPWNIFSLSVHAPATSACWWLWSAVLLSRSSEKVFSSSHLFWKHIDGFLATPFWVMSCTDQWNKKSKTNKKISCADTEAEVTPAHPTLCIRTLSLEGGVQTDFPFTLLFTNNVTLNQ